MIWVDENLVDYKKAINGLNYDKLGHETGLGSWGILVEIEDSFETPLFLYLGIKFDVISIITNRFITSFINIPKEIKERVQKTKKESDLNYLVSGVSTFTPDIEASSVIEFYVDIHKISLDVVEFLKTVYQYADTTEEYAALARDKVFMSGGRRASRGVSASMLRTYDGNLENFGFIFTRDGVEFVLNEMIVKDSIIHDEIKYTFWLTPHDREEYKFFKNDGDVPAETGSEYITGLGNEKMISQETEKLYQYDRRGFRSGYYDITVENPIVNIGYSDGNIEVLDTFQFAKDTSTRLHKHNAQLPIDARYQQHAFGTIASLLRDNIGPERLGAAKKAFDNSIRLEMLNIFKENPNGSFTAVFNDRMENEVISSIVSSFSSQIDKMPSDALTSTIQLAKETTVTPLYALNKLRDLRAINVDELQECVLFIYHPVVDKFVFYEMGQNDPAEITSNSILFFSDGTQYGVDLRGSYPVFIWSNFKKIFRETISSWINLKGVMYAIGSDPDPDYNPVEHMIAQTNSQIPVYDDLTFQGNCAKIIAINKDDIKDIVKKTKGIVDSEFIFGMKTGDIEVVRDGLWM